jgi:hypothetical protein
MVRPTSWAPKVGETLPRADQAIGVREKLATYALNREQEDGASKARGFALILGITIEHIDHLEAEIRAGIVDTPISSVRDNAPYGVNCVVELSVRGVSDKNERIVNVRTVWELTGRDAAPRLVSAYPRP